MKSGITNIYGMDFYDLLSDTLVYGKYQLAEDNPAATGTRITKDEAIRKWGFEIIEEILDRGSYLIPQEGFEATILRGD